MKISKPIVLVSLLMLSGCGRQGLGPELAYNTSTADAMRQLLEEGVAAGGAGGGSSLGEPTGWATLAGSFKINGPDPSRSPLKVDKDVQVCAPGGRQVLDQRIVIGEGDGITDVLIFVSSKFPSDDPQWEHESYQADKFGDVIFDQKQCIFLSHVATMRSTQKLKVLNSDPVGHNTKLNSVRGARSDNFTVPSGGFAYYEPGAASPAPFDIACSIHPWMSAYMMVCDHPYFAVTAGDGSFEIANVPAGVQLEFRVWQEAAGYLETVTVNGQGQKWSKGRFKLQLAPDERHEMNVVVDSSAF